MKFHWFHLMPYPYLPDDFKQNATIRSGSILRPPSSIDPVKGHQVYNDYLDQLEYRRAVPATTASASTSITRTATA